MATEYSITTNVYNKIGSCMFCFVKSGVLSLVFPITWFDIWYSYNTNIFYKRHLIYNYKESNEWKNKILYRKS